jgi:hypothetical protein
MYDKRYSSRALTPIFLIIPVTADGKMHISFSSATLVRSIFRGDVYLTTWPRELAERFMAVV